MTAASTAADGAVTPVIDYEPGINTAAPAPVLDTAPRRLRMVHPPPAPAPHEPDHFREAAAFVDAALRTLLEVIDRRRPTTHLRPLMAGGLFDSVLARSRAARPQASAAVLRHVRLQPCEHHEPAFEIAASYSRQSRLRAIACRIEQLDTLTGRRWQLVALHIG